ncbi:uncharacterized protein LOC124936368 [Impatiens glandulifera]|uniref:uncharacterized protein LOC124936368 n=1 Tax=Impatiens glandulifera TaxID=253017 RepID=UPI001FB10B81|nr:uncharacterized protein LOC124936368 [Impatiens glandulifera]
MVSDSISIVSIAMASSNQKDFAKKKRGNKSAKLKQYKLDARREQWLSQSQVKNKICKDDPDRDGGFSDQNMHTQKSDQSVENLEIKQRGQQNQMSVHNFIDSVSTSRSPTSGTSSGSDSKSGTSFTSSSSSAGSWSGSVTGEDEEVDDECLDDWEVLADALASLDCEQEHKSCSELSLGQGDIDNPNSSYEVSIQHPKPSLEPMEMETPQRAQEIGRAWKPDDAFRPRSLPYLSKQLSFPIKSERHHSCGCSKDVKSAPSSCPICFEDLDFTDSRFLPCSCGFRLCLFCHKRILEEDGRCPGCRKRYDNDCLNGESTFEGTVMTTQLAHSFSMIARS